MQVSPEGKYRWAHANADGTYATEQVTFRKKDLLAVDTIDPFEVIMSWDQLDEWL